MKKLSIVCLLLLLLEACAHTGIQRHAHSGKDLSIAQQNQLYDNIGKEIRDYHAVDLKECNCMKAFYRNLFSPPNNTARYVFDNKVGEYALKQSINKNSVSVLALGSGSLLNELTAFANILARGKNLKIYLTDWSYVFYGDTDFKEKALRLGRNPELIPEGWKDFYFWAWAKNHKEPYLPFFEKHHRAIDEFKAIIKQLDGVYHTKTTVEIIKPAADAAIILPPLDMIISIDAFIDLPNLMWNLFYQMKLVKNPVVFVSLNKTKPLGGFFESPDLKMRAPNSMKPVSIDIYDITSQPQHGSYQLIERMIFEPSKEQINHGPNFQADPNKDSTQSPLDPR